MNCSCTPVNSRGEHGQASPWTDMDGHGHGRTDGRPWTARKINKASASRLAPKIGILAISMTPVTLQLFFMPSDSCVVLLWWRFFGTLIFDGVRPSPALGTWTVAWTGAWTANKRGISRSPSL